MSNDFETETGHSVELIISETYTDRIDELRELASEHEKDYGELAFRFLQILEHLR